jgi:nucleoid-associated protein EbfC
MFNFGNPLAMLGKLQELPEKLKQLNERMQQETVSATSGCGSVTVVMSGNGHVRSISIGDKLSGPELETAVMEATNAAGAAAKQLYAESISKLAGDMKLNVPGLDGILAGLTGG